MKFTLKYTALFVLLLLLGCGHLFDKCGDNVLIGEYEVSPESLADWHPYRNADQLVFTDSLNNELVLDRVLDTSFVQVQTGKVLCWEESWDNSREYIRNEWVITRYAGSGHELEIQLFVGWHNMQTRFETDEIFDQVIYYSHGDQLGGTLELIASERGNDIDPGILDNPSFVKADSIRINGETFEDVWYFNREYPASVFTPTIYVKKGIGILGFMDDLNTIWLLKR